MRLVITRDSSSDEGTFSKGKLGEFDWDFLELPNRNNECGLSCIPPGIYTAILFDSPHFQRKVYRLQNVPGRSDVEMHPGNFAGDILKGWQSDLRGCMAPGMARGSLFNRHGLPQQAVVKSVEALDQIIEIAGETLEIEICAMSSSY